MSDQWSVHRWNIVKYHQDFSHSSSVVIPSYPKSLKQWKNTALIKPKAQRIADKIASLFVPIVGCN
jgi:hypothetical protein